jgi:hypothetical protein
VEVLAPASDGGHRISRDGGRVVNTRIGGYGEEFVDTGPGNGPALWRLREFAQGFVGRDVAGVLSEERVNEDVGVNGDHVPRPR